MKYYFICGLLVGGVVGSGIVCWVLLLVVEGNERFVVVIVYNVK